MITEEAYISLLERMKIMESEICDLQEYINKINGKYRKEYIKQKKKIDKFFDSLPGMSLGK